VTEEIKEGKTNTIKEEVTIFLNGAVRKLGNRVDLLTQCLDGDPFIGGYGSFPHLIAMEAWPRFKERLEEHLGKAAAAKFVSDELARL
jgi:hypothetical protein